MPLASIRPKFRLRTTLVVPFVLQIVAVVGLVSYLSFRNGQKAVTDLATQLSNQVSSRVSQQLNHYLATPRQANEINLQAIDLGMLKPQDLKTTGRFFWKQMKLSENLSYMNFGSPQGLFVGIGREDDGSLYIERIQPSDRFRYKRYALDQQGNPTKLLVTEAYPFQEDAWYKSAVTAGKPIWSPIYQWPDRPEIISVSSSYPVYDSSKQLVGVLGVDFILSQISNFLRSLTITPAGKIFVIERDGTIIASSSQEKPYRQVNGRAKRLNIAQSQEPLMRDAAQQLRDRFGTFEQITTPQLLSMKLNQEQAFVSVTPWQDALGLNWLVFTVIPESDFMQQINANTRNTLWLCLAALATSIAIGILTARWVTRPILGLSQASTDMAQGNIDQQVESSSLVEIDQLATSFNRMSHGMKQSFDALRHSEARNQALLNAIPDLMVEVSTEGIYLDAIAAKDGKWLVTDRESWAGQSVQAVLPAHVAQQYQQAVEQVLQSSKPLTLEYEFPVGEEMQTFEARVAACRENSALFLIRNISERKRSEAKRKQAEIAQVKSEERFQGLVANIPGAIYRCQCDSDWTMEYISDAIETISGYAASDFIQNQVRTYFSIIHPDDRDLVEVIVSHGIATQEPYVLDYRVLHQDGSIRWVYEQGQAVFGVDEDPLYLDGAIFDITERKESEEALKQSEATNRALINAIPDLLLRVRRDGTYLSDAVGASRLREFSGGTSSLAKTTVQNSLPNQQAQQRMAAIEQAFQTGNLQIYEHRLVINDHLIDEEVRVVVIGEDEVMVMVRDISDRKQAEEALRIAEENYRSIFENALEGIFQSSPAGRFISVNPAMAKIYGYDSPQEMIDAITNITAQIYVDPENHTEFQRQLEENDQVKGFEYRVYQKDSDIIWIQEDTRAVRDNVGQLLYYEGMIQDITERKRQEDELRRQLAELTIEIDQKKRQKEVAMLTESSYFQEVQQEIAEVNLDEFWS